MSEFLDIAFTPSEEAAHKLNDSEERLRGARFALSHYLEGKNEKTGNE